MNKNTNNKNINSIDTKKFSDISFMVAPFLMLEILANIKQLKY